VGFMQQTELDTPVMDLCVEQWCALHVNGIETFEIIKFKKKVG
jgi:hypothetical protein